MKKERDTSSWKSFLLTLAATTFSIVLTFGTTAIIDRKKQNAEKREMVMMIMYDMQESLKEVERIVIEDFQKRADKALLDYNNLRDLNSPNFIFYSEAFLRSMKGNFEECKLMMNVSDEDLDVFSRQKQKLMEATRANALVDTEQTSSERKQRDARLQQARKEGSK